MQSFKCNTVELVARDRPKEVTIVVFHGKWFLIRYNNTRLSNWGEIKYWPLSGSGVSLEGGLSGKVDCIGKINKEIIQLLHKEINKQHNWTPPFLKKHKKSQSITVYELLCKTRNEYNSIFSFNSSKRFYQCKINMVYITIYNCYIIWHNTLISFLIWNCKWQFCI